MKAMRHLAVLAAALALVSAQPGVALACRTPGRVPSADRTVDVYATSLAAAATDIDLAVAIRDEPIDLARWVEIAGDIGGEDDHDPMFGRPARVERAAELLSMGAASIVFRSQEKLKGEGADEFRLYGFWHPQTDSASDQRANSSGQSFHDDIPPGELWPTAFVSMCGRDISARAGRQYLIFRDADGRLLGVAAAGRPATDGDWGWAFEEVPPLGNSWLETVRRVSAPSR